MDAKGEVLITIMASLTQQESQSLSQNVKLGLQFRYQNGQVQVNHNHFLGYTKDDEGNLIIDPEQAEVVKRIYRCQQNKMVDQHHQQNPPKREIHRRCPASENLYHRLPEQDQSEEQWHRSTILCRRQP